jgi:hypothetical protein
MSGQNDFDFLIGDWRVRHRQLKARLRGCADWIEFDGTCTARKVLGGLGNTDEHVIQKPDGAYHAASMRAFDPWTRRWAIWWFDGRAPHGPVEPPMVGGFSDGLGTFLADEVLDGRAIKVRFRWIVGATPRWEQAFCADGGKTWETNWVMDFTPVSASAVAPRLSSVD